MPNMDLDNFKIYPRGFLGAQLGMRITTKRTDVDRNKGFVGTVGYKPLTNKIDANPNVEALYDRYIKTGGNMVNFDFKKNILAVAISAFGTQGFYYWFRQQYANPLVGDLHRRFLDDTLRFITTGKRNMMLQTWSSILNIGDSGEFDTNLSQDAVAFFNTDGRASYDRGIANVDLRDVIQKWCSQPNGITDLLGTLHLLFGELTN